MLFTLLGGLGLVLALVGVFGMTAYAVARRTQEIGVRMAFGARAGQVVATMVRDSAWPIVLGTIVGLGAAALATRVIASFLFNTTPTDPATFAAVAMTLAVAGCLAAGCRPARRAGRSGEGAAGGIARVNFELGTQNFELQRITCCPEFQVLGLQFQVDHSARLNVPTSTALPRTCPAMAATTAARVSGTGLPTGSTSTIASSA